MDSTFKTEEQDLEVIKQYFKVSHVFLAKHWHTKIGLN